ncbi:IS1 family transposase, partial [Escherichia coli]
SVELHDKVIGHYLNIKHYQSVGVITFARCGAYYGFNAQRAD